MSCHVWLSEATIVTATADDKTTETTATPPVTHKDVTSETQNAGE